jgi:hypothetical protein
MTIYKCGICNSIFSTIQAASNHKKSHKKLLIDNNETESDLEIGNVVDKLIDKTTVLERNERIEINENGLSDNVESNGNVEPNYVYLYV